MVKFTRINVFPKDYRVLLLKFSEEDARPAQGVLIQRALHHIDELEKEIEALREGS
ncbi:MAG: hypothetical protein KAJ33_02775 [Thermoplasmata archaeon]|nr:hypothetical protein [Thermoplasmata archaeon]